MVDADTESDAVAAAFFAAFGNRDGREVDLAALDSLCLPGCVIVRRGPEGVDVMDLTAFAAPRQALLTSGRLTDFEEREDAARTFLSGGVACRVCTYSKSGTLDGRPYRGRGFKSLHLVRTGQGWRISAVIWEDAPEGVDLDANVMTGRAS